MKLVPLEIVGEVGKNSSENKNTSKFLPTAIVEASDNGL